MKRMKLAVILLAVLWFLAACGASTVGSGGEEEAGETEQMPEQQETDTPDNGNSGGPRNGGRGGQGGGMMAANDPDIQAVLDENAEKFEQQTFADPDTGATLEYSLYIPEGYDGSADYPLLMFIPDSTGAGKSAKEIVEQYYGATVWVTEADQEKHPSFVVVPAFMETKDYEVTTSSALAMLQISHLHTLLKRL